MKPKLDPASQRAQGQLFDVGPALMDFSDMKNSMLRLADTIEWKLFEDHWKNFYILLLEKQDVLVIRLNRERLQMRKS